MKFVFNKIGIVHKLIVIDKYKISNELLSLIKDSEILENNIGRSDSKVYFLKNRNSNINYYLKVSKESKLNYEFQNELKVLKWLDGKLPVPKVIFSELFNGYNFLLISEIKGKDTSLLIDNPENTIKNLAISLKKIHQINIKDCQIYNSIDIKIKQAKLNLENNLVDETDFEEEYLGMKAEELFDLLIKKKPKTEELVFTHGDYCLPNIIFEHNKLSGYIDLGRAGIADKYQDIALLIRSIKHNFKENINNYITIFKKNYGISSLDKDKLDFYIILDEFF